MNKEQKVRNYQREREAGVWGHCVAIAKTAAVKLNTGSYPPILPASGNEQGLWHALRKKR